MKDREYCRFRLSPDCLGVGLKSTFVGRCCRKCYQHKQRVYYSQHREEAIKRAKLRQKGWYIHKRKKLEIIEEGLEPPYDAPSKKI